LCAIGRFGGVRARGAIETDFLTVRLRVGAVVVAGTSTAAATVGFKVPLWLLVVAASGMGSALIAVFGFFTC
jgi:hypothetical protein